MKIARVLEGGTTVALVGLLVIGSAVAADIEGTAYVASVRALVNVLRDGDSEAFEARFAKKVRGMQPDELWQAAHNLVARFGEIEGVELASLDEESGGAFVKVTFANAKREVFVRLSGEKKIRQLTYVPPDVH